MNRHECLDRLFQAFVTGGTPPQEEIRQLADAIETDDIPWLLKNVDDPRFHAELLGKFQLEST